MVLCPREVSASHRSMQLAKYTQGKISDGVKFKAISECGVTTDRLYIYKLNAEWNVYLPKQQLCFCE